MRFDDTLETVLASDLATPYGKQSAWRQLVDLIGRRRVPVDPRALSVLRAIRGEVPLAVRAASARGLEYANPPAALVRLLALDEIAVSLPVLRSARLNSTEWITLLPELSPPSRAVLRNRRDLSPAVRRALESFGPVDFVLPDESVSAVVGSAQSAPAAVEPEQIATPEPSQWIDWTVVAGEAAELTLPAADGAVPLLEAEAARGASLQAEPVLAVSSIDWTEVVAEQLAALAHRPQDSAPAPMDAVALGVPAATVEPAACGPEGEGGPVPQLAEVLEAPRLVPPAESLATAVPAAEDFSFVALAGLAPVLPRHAAQPVESQFESPPVQSGTAGPTPAAEPIAPPSKAAQDSAMAGEASELVRELTGTAAPESAEQASFAKAGEGEGPFEIAEVVARIDAFWRQQQDAPPRPPRLPVRADQFRFETDTQGVIRWVEGVSRAPLIGISLELASVPGASSVDGVAAGAFRRRAGFSNARLTIDGESDAAGAWLISGIPVFDPANGRFTGYRGTGRRPRVDERADPVQPRQTAPADSLRQLVHELRTPTNAIAGFAEMIETQMLGPVADSYRDRAHVIRSQAKELLGAIDDLDLAARLDSAALALVPSRVPLRPLLAGIADDLAQLAELRGSWIALPIDDVAVMGDRRAVERLLARLMATLVSASGPGERIGVGIAREADDMIAVSVDRPSGLADYPGETVLGIDDEREDTSLLGTGFALRLARNLARELGGSMVIEPERLTLRLPAFDNQPMGQAHLS